MEKDLESIEEVYNELCKKYKLPKFKDIDNEFEISCFEKGKFLTRNILRTIEEKLELGILVLGSIVHPDGATLSSMYEVRFFTDDEKNDMYHLFKKMMKANREIGELLLGNDEREQAEFVNNFFQEWIVIKKKLKGFIGKMKESWGKDTGIEEDIGYLG